MKLRVTVIQKMILLPILMNSHNKPTSHNSSLLGKVLHCCCISTLSSVPWLVLAFGVKWVYFRFLPLAPRLLYSSKIFSTALLASLVTASGSLASLLVGLERGLTRAIVWSKLTRVEKKYFLNNVEASLLEFIALIRQSHLFSQLQYSHFFNCKSQGQGTNHMLNTILLEQFCLY